MCYTSLSEILSEQLAPIFTQIFNRSLELCKVPLCFKRSTIIPIPKKSKITWLNYYSTKKKHYINVTNYYYYYRPVKLLKFADETTLIGFIQDGDESAYRQEVKELVVWCSLNNLELNTFKTVEMIVDFRKTCLLSPHSPSFRFLGTTISYNLKCDNHIYSIVEKAEQRLHFILSDEEVQPGTGAAETVLLCHHWICALHFYNCLVQLSYQIWS